MTREDKVQHHLKRNGVMANKSLIGRLMVLENAEGGGAVADALGEAAAALDAYERALAKVRDEELSA